MASQYHNLPSYAYICRAFCYPLRYIQVTLDYSTNYDVTTFLFILLEDSTTKTLAHLSGNIQAVDTHCRDWPMTDCNRNNHNGQCHKGMSMISMGKVEVKRNFHRGTKFNNNEFKYET